jgi:hypothetical protein
VTPPHKRPLGKVFKFRAVVQLVADVAGHPSPFADKLVVRAVRGMIRDGTQVARNQGPTLDVQRVLELLQQQTIERERVGLAIPRAQAAAAVSAVVPSRPGELVGLLMQDVTFIFKSTAIGVADRSVSASALSPSRLPQIPRLGEIFPPFLIEFTVHNSKTDKLRKYGIRKTMQHPRGASWSPALVLLRYCTVRCERKYVFGKEDQPSQPIAVPTISTELADVAVAATGTRVSARFWRPAAATWLLLCGLDVETVAALGGWATTDSLRKHYVRVMTWRPSIAAAIAGVELSIREAENRVSQTTTSPFDAMPPHARPDLVAVVRRGNPLEASQAITAAISPARPVKPAGLRPSASLRKLSSMK